MVHDKFLIFRQLRRCTEPGNHRQILGYERKSGYHYSQDIQETYKPNTENTYSDILMWPSQKTTVTELLSGRC